MTGIHIKLTLLLLANYAYTTKGVCLSCGTASGVACVTETSFVTCFDGNISNNINTCPLGTVCTDLASICMTGNVTADCSASTATTSCNVCSADNRFACITPTSFSLCFGTIVPSSTMVITCPSGQYCDIQATPPNFCSTNATANNCTDATTTTTTATPNTSTATTIMTAVSTTNATELCSATALGGRFAHPSDNTCQQYYYCYLYAGNLRGQFYSCIGTTVFNPNVQRCVQPNGSFICGTTATNGTTMMVT